MPKITFLRSTSGDWEGLYVNGILKTESHSLELREVLTILGLEYETLWVDTENGDQFPQKLEDANGKEL